MQPAQPIRLHGFPLSGHSHRVELFLSLLDLPYEFIYVDLPNKAQKEPGFLAKNPRGQVPVIEDGDVTLYDSTAILVYLAKRYGNSGWLPDDATNAAKVQQFLSLASGEVLEGPGKARLVKVFNAPHDYELAKQKAASLLQLMETHLSGGRNFLVGTHPTIADIACYSYVAHAPEGGVNLTPYPQLRAWIARVESLRNFVPMPASPLVA
ncbi:glutathione S-transferase [Herbaspirillum sp. meg3]|uniref:glutathione S-transferase family protein n=1 Tax=Herbaspirillum sp. meg3 TaxID=2025949 RepID=UPI000B98B210|nr:glutathione S-transferase [Herbaspirillum sp. meg3]ASU36988.1 glutathione S-transferase [Herbaspirillum sp. meg3]